MENFTKTKKKYEDFLLKNNFNNNRNNIEENIKKNQDKFSKFLDKRYHDWAD